METLQWVEIGIGLSVLLCGITLLFLFKGSPARRHSSSERKVKSKSSRGEELCQAPVDIMGAAIAKLSDSDAEVRLAALQTLVMDHDALSRAQVSIQPSRSPSVTISPCGFCLRLQFLVSQRLYDNAWFVREAAVDALGRLILPSSQALDYFLPAMDDPDDKVTT